MNKLLNPGGVAGAAFAAFALVFGYGLYFGFGAVGSEFHGVLTLTGLGLPYEGMLLGEAWLGAPVGKLLGFLFGALALLAVYYGLGCMINWMQRRKRD